MILTDKMYLFTAFASLTCCNLRQVNAKESKYKKLKYK